MTNMKLLSTKQAAAMFEVQPRTVARWCRDGELRAVKLGRVWRIPIGAARILVRQGK